MRRFLLLCVCSFWGYMLAQPAGDIRAQILSLREHLKKASPATAKQNNGEAKQMLALAEKAGDDKLWAITYNTLSKRTVTPTASEREIYLNKALYYAQKSKDAHEIANAYAQYGIWATDKGDLDNAITYFKKSENLFIVEEDRAATRANMARAHLRKGEYSVAFSYIIKALAYFDKINHENTTVCYYAAADILYRNKEYNKAIEYTEKGLARAKKEGNTRYIALFTSLLGGIYLAENNTQASKKHLLAALSLHEQLKDSTGIAGQWLNLGLVLLQEGDYHGALPYVSAALPLFEKNKDKSNITMAYRTLAVIYNRQKQYPKAIEAAEKALAVADASNSLPRKREAYESLSLAYAGLHEYEKAYKYRGLQADMRDSIFNDTRQKQLAELRTQYETEKQQQQLQALAQLNTISALENEKQKLENKTIQQKLTETEQLRNLQALESNIEAERKQRQLGELVIAKKQTQLVGIAIIGILGILLMGGGIFFYRFRLKKRTESLHLIQARSESELRALQAQMNPHFMFNILNSIQGAFYLGDKRAANAQMGLLASLTRKVLYMSNQKQISLQEEMEFLTEYITLEKARFNDDFIVEMKIEDSIDEESLFMPPMLIQPYIENAIKHGLAPQKGEKRLHIHLWVAEKQLHCTISDNGIGRDAAATIAHHRQKYHTSFASEATARRLELLNQYQETPVSVRYHDGASENMAGAVGTTVHLTIPIVVEL